MPKKRKAPPNGGSAPPGGKKNKTAAEPESSSAFVVSQDTPARYFRPTKEKVRPDQSPCNAGYYWIQSKLEEAPTKRKDMHDFIIKHGLCIGDIVQWGDGYRDVDSHLVVKDRDRLILSPNQDDPGSGYLTIPMKVTSYFPDSLKKYDNIMGSRFVNLYLTPDDRYIQETFGEVPRNWYFDVYFDSKEFFSVGIYTSHDGCYSTENLEEAVEYVQKRTDKGVGLLTKKSKKGKDVKQNSKKHNKDKVSK